jgi:hypothetical protein
VLSRGNCGCVPSDRGRRIVYVERVVVKRIFIVQIWFLLWFSVFVYITTVFTLFFYIIVVAVTCTGPSRTQSVTVELHCTIRIWENIRIIRNCLV